MLRLICTYTILSLILAVHSISAPNSKSPPTHWVLPDLTVENVTSPVHTGAGYQVQVTVRNIGKGASAPFNLLFRDNYTGSGQLRQVARLLHAQSLVATFVISPPENQGPWYYSAIADYGNVVRETNESNNVKTVYQY